MKKRKLLNLTKNLLVLDAGFSDLQLKSQVETQKFNLIVVNLEKNIEERNTLIKELKHGTKETSDVLQSTFRKDVKRRTEELLNPFGQIHKNLCKV